MSINPPDPWVLVGRIGKAHGLEGAVRVWPEADLGEIFDNQVPLRLWSPSGEPGREMVPLSVRKTGGVWVVLWKGITNRDSTGPLRNQWIVARREDLPEPREGSAYWADLLAARVETKQGEPVGVVKEIHDLPAQTVLEIESPDQERFLLPLSEEVDAELLRSSAADQPNRLVVFLPEGMVEATSIEERKESRKGGRRSPSRKKNGSAGAESR